MNESLLITKFGQDVHFTSLHLALKFISYNISIKEIVTKPNPNLFSKLR